MKAISPERRKYITGMLLGLGVIVLVWVGMVEYCYVRSKTIQTYAFDDAKITGVQDGLTMRMKKSKEWKDPSLHANNPQGAQYDFSVINDASHPFMISTINMRLSRMAEFDSGWNGDFTAKDDFITISPTENSQYAPSLGETEFGAVLYSTGDITLRSYEISGYWNVSLTDLGCFWIMIELTGFYLVLIFVKEYLDYRSRVYDKQKLRDEKIIEQSMTTLSSFIDAKDVYTKNHSYRVALYAQEIAKRMGMSDEECKNTYFITLMHDCGKVAIPDEILKKTGVLTPDEFVVVKSHTVVGAELLKDFDALKGIRDGAYYHHERYDGYGYPSKLEGENIPIIGRIIGVADAYDAMSSNRCYRNALSKDKIMLELTGNSGKQFDPQIVPIMISMINDGFVDNIKSKYLVNG